MAVNKYFEDERGVRGRPDINGNHMYIAYKILTGKGDWNHIYSKHGPTDEWLNSKISDEQINNSNKPNHIVCVARIRKSGDAKKTLKAQNTDGTEAILTDSHAYAVVRSDSDFVYLINPWDTSKEIKVDRKTFKEFFNDIDEFDL